LGWYTVECLISNFPNSILAKFEFELLGAQELSFGISIYKLHSCVLKIAVSFFWFVCVAKQKRNQFLLKKSETGPALS